MALVMSSRTHSPGKESVSSHENGVGHTIVVKTTSSSSTDSAASSASSSPNEDIQTATTHTPSSAYPPSNGLDSSHKRKRSDEGDAQRSSPHRQYDYSPPTRVEQPQHMADRALHVLDDDQPRPSHYSNGHPIATNGHWHHDRQSQPPSATSTQPNGMPDQSWDVTTPTNGPSYDLEVNGSIPKRKRNFANRTKTGCMTCRKRKKKCDEARPHCNNCTRGGFQCEGYNTAKASSNGFWTPTTKPPVPLQSKEGQGEEPPTTLPPSRPQNRSPEGTRPYENGPTRQIPGEEHEQPSHPYATENVAEPRKRPHYPGQPWPPQQGPSAYTKDSLPHVPEPGHSSQTSSRDMSRPPTQGTSSSLPSAASYHSAPPPPQPQQHQHQQQHQAPPPVTQAPQQYPAQPVPQPPTHAPSHAQPSYYTPPPQTEYRQYAQPPPPPSTDYSRPSTHSRMSSSAYEPRRGASKPFFAEDVERSKMNRSVQYNRLDPTLVDDRNRCRRALARYHAACAVDSGLDDEQARRILEKVFDPARDESHNFKTVPDRRGTLSHKVKIEPGFCCTYGYNLVMMDSVYIAENTTIDDSGRVEIGARTTIGANVKIITNEPCKDLIDRKGSQGSWIAKDVYIGTGVVIGDNVIIYPDVRLENGVTVEPGAIVRDSAPENAVLRANAAYRPSQTGFV